MLLKVVIYGLICCCFLSFLKANPRDWPNPTVFNIGGVLSSNESEKYFQETIAHLNFDSQYVPKGVTYYHTAILMDPNPIRTALNVCKYLISRKVMYRIAYTIVLLLRHHI
uniref:Glutamate [NMDA] receptor subunit 1-like n=1 Tax=Diabrotica virgifera virgifera TaxID=50390 RepID=A0A6P7FJT0_DIAVI